MLHDISVIMDSSNKCGVVQMIMSFRNDNQVIFPLVL